ncbi:regulatory iron-sulfur-containing complex subunit RicT [Alistipes megaguti]|uniref:regulatory iron-sulfur-containing complex subunit RicT n=1 Tax=Alistipes megaguti TaxID=2364787 RepID=UPI000EFB5FF8|nr:regulatory iron-sulfur-containing complex subunit RicT [Alistipes megaguti]
MEIEKPHDTGAFKPEVGRGCAFCNCGAEPEVRLCDGCFKLHETPWLDEYPVNEPTDIVEVRFKNTRRSFYQNVNHLDLKRGDIVAVEASPGHDIGIVSLTGDLVARQMRRIGFNPYNGEYKKIYRKAKPYDIERWQEAIALEHETMIASRQIAADMGLNMKIGDVEYQGDKIKAIFYYIADERVDFRELIKVFAERFHIRIEMKQIGARQEAGRIGGLGACGRELCCASWMSTFSSVTTGAARVQDISLNPQKLAGQCSKLKCCMMYEYDAYVDARKEFPRLREPLQTEEGEWFLVKSDVLAGTMTFSSSKETMSNLTTLPVSRVKEILALNRQGKKAERLQHADDIRPTEEEPTYRSEEDSITRFDQAKRRKRGGKNKNRNNPNGQNAGENTPNGQKEQETNPANGAASANDGHSAPRSENGRRNNRGNRGNRENRGNRQENQGGPGNRGDHQDNRESQDNREPRENGARPANGGDAANANANNNGNREGRREGGRNHRRNHRRGGQNGQNGGNGGNNGNGEANGSKTNGGGTAPVNSSNE